MSWYVVPWVAVTGNQPRRTPKISWAKLPITKMGMEISTKVLTVTNDVDELSSPDPREHPCGDADHGLDDQRHDAELECGRPTCGQFVDHLVAEEVRAQVTLQQVAHVEQVLDDQRLVEVVVGPELGDVTLRTRPLAAASDGRIPEGEDRDIDDEGDADDDRDHLQQPPDDVLAHPNPLS